MKQLRRYQEEVVARGVADHTYVILPCGSGKTIVAIETVKGLRALHAVPQQAALVVVSPKLAVNQWVRVIKDQDPEAIPIAVEIGSGLPEFSNREPYYLVMHYEALVRYVRELEQLRFLCVITDESQNLRNRDTQRSMAIHRLRALRKIALSGTPTDKSQAELWNVLHWFDNREFSSYWNFVDKYFMYTINVATGNKMPSKVKDNAEFRGKVGPYVTIRTKQQITPELPPKQVTLVRVPMFAAQRRAYDDLRLAKDIEVFFDSETGLLDPMLVPNAISRLVRLQQVASNPMLLNMMLPSCKMEWIEGYVADNNKEPMLIFTKFRQTAIQLAKLLGAALVVGGRSAEHFDEFLSGQVTVLVGTIEAMGAALDLPMANTTIFMDLSWSSINMRQARDRMRDAAVGQPPKQLIYLLAEKSVDDLILQALVRKFTDQMVATQLFAGETSDGSYASVADGVAATELAASAF